jgi:hypothetical protein
MLLVLSVLLSLSSADMPLFLLAGVFLYCYWYQLLDMLPLLLMLMDYLLDRTQKRIGLIGLASGGGSNEHSTASSRQRWMSNLYISSFSIKAGMDSEKVLRSVPLISKTCFSSPSLLGMIQAFKLADQIMGSHPQR